ncbi:MAG: hypothetical protein SGPRY_011664, partial [Prymnesium sp.]
LATQMDPKPKTEEAEFVPEEEEEGPSTQGDGLMAAKAAAKAAKAKRESNSPVRGEKASEKK